MPFSFRLTEPGNVILSKLEFPGEPIGNGRFHGQLMPQQIMETTKATKPRNSNPYRIKATQALKEEGFDSLDSFARHVMWDGECRACCSEGCVVEPDGTCSHGCPSILLVLGMI